MAVTVPIYDLVNYNLQAQIANKLTQLSNATQALNGALVNTLQMDLNNLQLQLCISLLGAGALVPATVISTMSYITPNANGPVNAATSSQGPNAGIGAAGQQ
jgi:hypothetical protein